MIVLWWCLFLGASFALGWLSAKWGKNMLWHVLASICIGFLCYRLACWWLDVRPLI
jgi:hypothetical protein